MLHALPLLFQIQLTVTTTLPISRTDGGKNCRSPPLLFKPHVFVNYDRARQSPTTPTTGNASFLDKSLFCHRITFLFELLSAKLSNAAPKLFVAAIETRRRRKKKASSFRHANLFFLKQDSPATEEEEEEKEVRQVNMP